MERMREHNPYESKERARGECDDALIQCQGPRFKPILSAIALIVAEVFLFTQAAWALDFNRDGTRRLMMKSVYQNQLPLFPNVAKIEEQKQLILERKNIAVESAELTQTDEFLSSELSRVMLEQLESRPLGEPLEPSLIAQIMGQFQGEGTQWAGALSPLEPSPSLRLDSTQPLPALEESRPDPIPSEKADPLSEAKGEEEILPNSQPYDIDAFHDVSSSSLESVLEEKSVRSTMVGKSFIEVFLNVFHGVGRASMKALMAEIEAFEEAVYGAKEGKARQEGVQSAGVGEREERVETAPVRDPIPTEEPPVDTPTPGEPAPSESPPSEEPGEDPFSDPFFDDTRDAFDDPFFDDDYEFPDGEEEFTPPGPPQSWNSPPRTSEGVIRDENGDIISTYTVNYSTRTAIVNNRLVIVGGSHTYTYTNADGTTGVETVEWHYTFGEDGKINGKERTTFRDGWVPDRENKTGPVYYDHVTVTETSSVKRDDQGRVIEFEITRVEGNKKIHYVYKVDKYDSADNRAEWSEITEITDLSTGEVLTLETIGEATGYDEEGRITGSKTTTHVHSEGVDPEVIEAIRPELDALASAFSDLAEFLSNKHDALTSGLLSEEDKETLDALIGKVSDAIGVLSGIENLPVVVETLLNNMEATLTNLQESIVAHERTRQEWYYDPDRDGRYYHGEWVTVTYYTYGFGGDDPEGTLTEFIDTFEQFHVFAAPDTFTAVTDYTITSEIRNITYDANNEWASFEQTTVIKGIAKRSDGTIVEYNRVIETSKTGTLNEYGLLEDATYTITTTLNPSDQQYDSQNPGNNLITETFQQSDMTYTQGLMVGDNFYNWATLMVALMPLLGITDETFKNGVLDAQDFIDALGMDLNLEEFLGTLPEGTNPDDVDRVVFELLTAFIFAAVTGGELNQDILNSAINASVASYNHEIRSLTYKILSSEERAALEQKRDAFKAQRSELQAKRDEVKAAAEEWVTQLAEAIFSHLDAYRTEGPLRDTLFTLLKGAGVHGDLLKAEAKFLLNGYHEIITRTRGGVLDPEIEEHDVGFVYDEKGELIEITDSVHAYADELFKDTALYSFYKNFMDYLNRPDVKLNTLIDLFKAFKNAVIKKYGSLEDAPAEIREFISRFDDALSAGGFVAVARAILGFKAWANTYDLANKTIRTKDVSYTIIQSDFVRDEAGRVVRYHERRIGIDVDGTILPDSDLVVERDVSRVYSPEGRLLRETSVDTYISDPERWEEINTRLDELDQEIAAFEEELFSLQQQGAFVRPSTALYDERDALLAERDELTSTRTTVKDEFAYDAQGNLAGYHEVTKDQDGLVVNESYVSEIITDSVTGFVIRIKRTTWVEDYVVKENPEVRIEYDKRYDPRGNLIGQEVIEDGNLYSESFRYNDLDQVIYVRNNEGEIFNFRYDIWGRNIAYDFKPFSGPVKIVHMEEIRYDSFNNVIYQRSRSYYHKDSKNHGWQTEIIINRYDQNNRLIWKHTFTEFKGKSDGKTVKYHREWDTYVYTYKNEYREVASHKHHEATKVKKSFWQKLFDFIIDIVTFSFQWIGKIAKVLGWRGLDNTIQKLKVAIFFVILSVVTMGVLAPALLGLFGLAFATFSFVNIMVSAFLSGLFTALYEWANGVRLGEALENFGKSLIITAVTFGLGHVLKEALQKIGQAISNIGRAIINAGITIVSDVVKVIRSVVEWVVSRIGQIKNWLGQNGGLGQWLSEGSKFIQALKAYVYNFLKDFSFQAIAEAIAPDRPIGFLQWTGMFMLGSIFGNVVYSILVPEIQHLLDVGDAFGPFAVGLYGMQLAYGARNPYGGINLAQLVTDYIRNEILGALRDHFRPDGGNLSFLQMAAISAIRSATFAWGLVTKFIVKPIISLVNETLVRLFRTVRALAKATVQWVRGQPAQIALSNPVLWASANVTKVYKNLWNAILGRDESRILTKRGDPLKGEYPIPHGTLMEMSGFDENGNRFEIYFDISSQTHFQTTYRNNLPFEIYQGTVDTTARQFIPDTRYNTTGLYGQYHYDANQALVGITFYGPTGQGSKVIIDQGYFVDIQDLLGNSLIWTSPEATQALKFLQGLSMDQVRFLGHLGLNGFTFYGNDGKPLAILNLVGVADTPTDEFLIYGPPTPIYGPPTPFTDRGGIVPVVALNFAGEHFLPTQFIVDGKILTADVTTDIVTVGVADTQTYGPPTPTYGPPAPLTDREGNPLYFTRITLQIGGENGVSPMVLNGVDVRAGTVDLYMNASGQVAFVELDTTKFYEVIGSGTFYARLPDSNQLYTLRDGVLNVVEGLRFDKMTLQSAVEQVGLSNKLLAQHIVERFNEMVDVLMKDNKIIDIDYGLISISYDESGNPSTYQFKGDEYIYKIQTQTIDGKEIEMLTPIAVSRVKTVEELKAMGVTQEVFDAFGNVHFDRYQAIIMLNEKEERLSIRSLYTTNILGNDRLIEAGQVLFDVFMLGDTRVYSFPADSPLVEGTIFEGADRNFLYVVENGEFKPYGSIVIQTVGEIRELTETDLAKFNLADRFGVETDTKLQVIYKGQGENAILYLIQGNGFQISFAYTNDEVTGQPLRAVTLQSWAQDGSLNVHQLIYNSHQGGDLIQETQYTVQLVGDVKVVTNYRSVDYAHNTVTTATGNVSFGEEGELVVRDGQIVVTTFDHVTGFNEARKKVSETIQTFDENAILVTLSLWNAAAFKEGVLHPEQRIDISYRSGGQIDIAKDGTITVGNGLIVVNSFNEKLNKWEHLSTYQGEELFIHDEGIDVRNGTWTTEQFVVYYDARGEFSYLAFTDPKVTEQFMKIEQEILGNQPGVLVNGQLDAPELAVYLNVIQAELKAEITAQFTASQKMEVLDSLFSFMNVFKVVMAEDQQIELAAHFKEYVRFKIDTLRADIHQRLEDRTQLGMIYHATQQLLHRSHLGSFRQPGAHPQMPRFYGGFETAKQLLSLLDRADEAYQEGRVDQAYQWVNLAQRFDMLQQAASSLEGVQENYFGLAEKLLTFQANAYEAYGQEEKAAHVRSDLQHFLAGGYKESGIAEDYKNKYEGTLVEPYLTRLRSLFAEFEFGGIGELIFDTFKEVQKGIISLLQGGDVNIEGLSNSLGEALQRLFDRRGVELVKLGEGFLELEDGQYLVYDAIEDAPVAVVDQYGNPLITFRPNGLMDVYTYHFTQKEMGELGQIEEEAFARYVEDGKITTEIGANLGGFAGIIANETMIPSMSPGFLGGLGAYFQGFFLKILSGLGIVGQGMATYGTYLYEGGLNTFMAGMNKALNFLDQEGGFLGKYVAYPIVNLLGMTAIILSQLPEFIGKLGVGLLTGLGGTFSALTGVTVGGTIGTLTGLSAASLGQAWGRLGTVGVELFDMARGILNRFNPSSSLYNIRRGLAETGAFVLAALTMKGVFKGAVKGAQARLGLLGRAFARSFDRVVERFKFGARVSGDVKAQGFAKWANPFGQFGFVTRGMARFEKGPIYVLYHHFALPLAHTASFIGGAWLLSLLSSKLGALFGKEDEGRALGGLLFAGRLATRSMAPLAAYPVARIAQGRQVKSALKLWDAVQRRDLPRLRELLNRRKDHRELLEERAKDRMAEWRQHFGLLAEIEISKQGWRQVFGEILEGVTREYVEDLYARADQLAKQLDLAVFARLYTISEKDAVDFLMNRWQMYSPVRPFSDVATRQLQFIVDGRTYTPEALLDIAKPIADAFKTPLDLSPGKAYTLEQLLLNRAFQVAVEGIGETKPFQHVMASGQFAFAYEALRRADASFHGNMLAPALLQLVQSRGKTSGFGLATLALLDQAKIEGRDVRLGIVASKQSLVGEYLKDPFIQLIKHNKDYSLIEVAGRGPKVKEALHGAPKQAVILMDNAAFKTLALDFIKFEENQRIGRYTYESLMKQIAFMERRLAATEAAGLKDVASRWSTKLGELLEIKEKFDQKLDSHPLNRFDYVFVDEPQEMFADPFLQEAVGSDLLPHLPKERRALYVARALALAKIFTRVFQLLHDEGLVRLTPEGRIELGRDIHQIRKGIISNTIKNQEVRNRVTLEQIMLDRIKDEFARDPDVRKLKEMMTTPERGVIEIESLANTALNLLLGKIKEGQDYVLRLSERDGRVKVTYDVAHEGEGLADTVFGDKNIGAMVVLRDYFERYLNQNLDRLLDQDGRFILKPQEVSRGLTDLGALEDVASHLLHEEIRSITTLGALSLVGLGKITAGTGTAGGIKQSLRSLGFDVLELTKEPKIRQNSGRFNLLVVGRDQAPRVAYRTIQQGLDHYHDRAILVNSMDAVESGKAARFSGEKFGDRALVVDASRIDMRTPESIQASIAKILSDENYQGKKIVLFDLSTLTETQKRFALGAVRDAITNFPERQFVVFSTRLATGLNTLGIKPGERAYTASLIQLGASRADDLNQFAGRGRNILNQEIFHRADVRRLTAIVDFERQGNLLESEKAAFRNTFQIRDPAERRSAQLQVFEKVQSKMQEEVDLMNLHQVVQISEGQRGVAATAFEFMKRLPEMWPVWEGTFYHAQQRPEILQGLPIFLELANLDAFTGALLKLAKSPADQAYVTGLVDFLKGHPDLVDTKGAFTQKGLHLLSMIDLVIDTHTPTDLVSELRRNGPLTAIDLKTPVSLSVSQLSPIDLEKTKPKDYALDFVRLAVDRTFNSKTSQDIFTLHVATQALRFVLQSSLDEAGSYLLEAAGTSSFEMPLLLEADVQNFIQDYRSNILQGVSPHLAARSFRDFYLNLLTSQMEKVANRYEKEHLLTRIQAIKSLIENLEQKPPANPLDVIRHVGEVNARYQDVTSRELFTVLYPYMTLAQRLRYTDYVDRQMEVLGTVPDITSLDEKGAERLRAILSDFVIDTLKHLNLTGPLSIVKFGNKVGIFTTLNQSPVTVFSTERGVGVQLGFSLLVFERNEETEKVTPLADRIIEVNSLVDDPVSKQAWAFLRRQGYTDEEPFILAEVGHRVFYLKPNSFDILYEQESYEHPEPSLIASVQTIAKKALGKELQLSPASPIRFDVEYQSGRPIFSHVYSGDQRLFSVNLAKTEVSKTNPLYRGKFMTSGADEDQTVIMAQFIDGHATQLSMTVKNLVTQEDIHLDFEIPILMRPGMSYVPISQLVLFQGTLADKIAKFQMPLRPVVMNFDDRHSLMDQNSQPTVEVEENHGDVPFLNIHPAFLERSYRFAGFDPAIETLMDGKKQAVHQFEGQRARGYIHEAIGHLRIHPKGTMKGGEDVGGQYYIQTDEAIAESLSGGVDRLVFDPSHGQYVVPTMNPSSPTTPSLKGTTATQVYSPPHNAFVSVEAALAFGSGADLLQGDAALHQAVRLVDFLVVNQDVDRFNEEKITKRIERFVDQSPHDYQILVDNPDFYNEVKRLSIQLAKAYFEALEQVRDRTQAPGVATSVATQGVGSPLPPESPKPIEWLEMRLLIVPLTRPGLFSLVEAETGDFLATFQRMAGEEQFISVSQKFYDTHRGKVKPITLTGKELLSSQTGLSKVIRERLEKSNLLKTRTQKVEGGKRQHLPLEHVPGIEKMIIQYFPGVGQNVTGTIIVGNEFPLKILTVSGKKLTLDKRRMRERRSRREAFQPIEQDRNTLLVRKENEVIRVFEDGKTETTIGDQEKALREAVEVAKSEGRPIPITYAQLQHLGVEQLPQGEPFALFSPGNGQVLYLAFRDKESRSEVFARMEAYFDEDEYAGGLLDDQALSKALGKHHGEFYQGSSFSIHKFVQFYHAALEKNIPLNQEELALQERLVGFGVIAKENGRFVVKRETSIASVRHDLPLDGLSTEGFQSLVEHELLHTVQHQNPQMMAEIEKMVGGLPRGLSALFRAYVAYKGYNLRDADLVLHEMHAYFRDGKGVLDELVTFAKVVSKHPQLLSMKEGALELYRIALTQDPQGKTLLRPGVEDALKWLSRQLRKIDRPYFNWMIASHPKIDTFAERFAKLETPAVQAADVTSESPSLEQFLASLGIDTARTREEVHGILDGKGIPYESGVHATVISPTALPSEVVKILDHPDSGVNAASLQMYQTAQDLVNANLVPPYTIRQDQPDGRGFSVVTMEKVEITSGELLKRLMDVGQVDQAIAYLRQGVALYQGLLKKGYFVDPDSSDRFTKDTGLYQGRVVLHLDVANLTKDPVKIGKALARFEAWLMEDLTRLLGEKAESLRPTIQSEIATFAVAAKDGGTEAVGERLAPFRMQEKLIPVKPQFVPKLGALQMAQVAAEVAPEVPELQATLPQPAEPVSAEVADLSRPVPTPTVDVAGEAAPAQVVSIRRYQAIPLGSMPEGMRAQIHIAQMARVNREDLWTAIQKLKLEDRILLDESIEKIGFPEQFIRSVDQGTIHPQELAKLLILMGRILKAGAIDGIAVDKLHINGINPADVQKLQERLEAINFEQLQNISPEIMGLQDFWNFMNGIGTGLSTELFVMESAGDTLRRQV